MGAGAFIEPLVVVTLLFGGTWINRNKSYTLFPTRKPGSGHSSPSSPHPHSPTSYSPRSASPDSLSGRSSPISSSSLLSKSSSDSIRGFFSVDTEPKWRKRELRFLGLRTEVTSPNTRRFRDYFLSSLLRKFPFLVEAWYWALIYWVYQLGRAFTAVTLSEDTVDVARKHALQIIHLEQRLHIFLELPVQHWFLKHPTLLHWTNRTYSFIHIPGTIAFLVGLYYYTTLRRRASSLPIPNKLYDEDDNTINTRGPKLYAARRRTMAVCNLLAFIVFTLWPCMPPRLLSDPDVEGPIGEEARSYGFVDTVHGAEGESSVWTQNRFCNQYAAMPSLHFGYSLLIGLTVMTLPLANEKRGKVLGLRIPGSGKTLRLRGMSAKRMVCLIVGFLYPAIILTAIVATANHFILDAVAGATVCGIAWCGNRVLLNLLALEDYFLWCVRIYKPVRRGEEDDEEWGIEGWEKKGPTAVN